ncbi:transglutaminaseTgpA domain-containing protein [Streptomyces sp. ZYX-F-203]
MSGQARLAVRAWAATLAASCALLPLVDPFVWILQAAFFLAVTAAVGMGARRASVPRALVPAAQAAVGLVLLTLVFARGQAVAGVLPGPAVLVRFAELLRQGGDDMARYAVPAPLESDGIRLMLVGGVLLIGVCVDALAVTFRAAASAGLPLLAVYSVAAGLSGGSGGWFWFLIAAAGYLSLLLADGRDRLARWGRFFGGARDSPPAPGRSAGAPARSGRRIGAAVLGAALLVPLALPAMDGGLLDPAGARASSDGGGGTIAAVNPLVSLRDSLNADEDREVLSVTTDAAVPSGLYLRIVSLDVFDGATWTPAERRIIDVPAGAFPAPAGLGPDVPREEVSATVSAADWYAQDWLPMPYPPIGVRVEGDWRYEPTGMTLIGDHGQNTRGLTYEVDALEVLPTAERLAAAPPPPEAVAREYTSLPDSVPAVVERTARAVTSGASTAYARAVMLQEYFAADGRFAYDTEVALGDGPEAISRFLRDKRGFCVHYSFAMAAMARSLEIPARVAVGFAPGTPRPDGTISVGLRDAHAWPELYFEGVGWTRFEPTPTRGSAPPYTVANAPGATTPDAPLPSRGSSTSPSQGPSDDESCAPAADSPGPCASSSPEAAPPSAAGGPPWGTLATRGLGALLILAVPLVPMLWRMRTRAVRLQVGGGGAAADGSGALAAWRELTDTAWDLGIAPRESETPRAAAARMARLGALGPAAGASLDRIARDVERTLYAPVPGPVADPAADARRVIAGFRAAAGRAARWRAVLAPRSSVRAAWAVGERLRGSPRRAVARVRRPRAPGRRD